MQDRNPMEIIKTKYNALKEQLDERTRRLWAATEANAFGRGGNRIVSKATGMTELNIRLGRRELISSQRQVATMQRRQRIRYPGGGRKDINSIHAGLL